MENNRKRKEKTAQMFKKKNDFKLSRIPVVPPRLLRDGTEEEEVEEYLWCRP